MKRGIKIVLITIGAVIVLFFITALVYRFVFSQGIVNSYEVNNSIFDQKVLIATQQSNFKEKLTSAVIEEFNKETIYIRVIDVTKLHEISEEEWDVVIILSTIQSSELQAQTQEYLQRTNREEKHIVLITSGSGDWKIEGAFIDSISSASKANTIDSVTERITAGIRQILDDESNL